MCTHPWPRLHARCALGRPCRGLPLVVSQPVLGRVVAMSQACRCAHRRAVSQRFRVCRSAPVPCRRALLRRIAVCIAAPIATQRPPPATIQFLYRDSPASHVAHAAAGPYTQAGRVVRMAGRIVAVSRPRPPPLPPACPGLFVCSACYVPARPAVCLLSLLCAYSACYVSAQPAVCHNTAEPAVCLLSLLCATIQLSVLCVCSACCVPLRAAMCHNTAEPAVCVLCAFSACCVPQYS